MNPIAKSSLALLVLLFATLAAAGCGDETGPAAPGLDEPAALDWSAATAPAPGVRTAPGPSPYPLQLGNRWKYRAHVRIEALDGSGAPPVEEVVRTTKTEIVGVRELLGRCYVVEESAITESDAPDDVLLRYVFYRQDRDGLYEADTEAEGPIRPAVVPGPDLVRSLQARPHADAWLRAATEVALRVELVRSGRAPAAGYENELLRLDYPLHRGKSWIVVDDAFRMSSTVEGREVLDLPAGRTPAWRVRMDSDLFGPDDSVHFFYGRDGYLGARLTVYGDVVDDDGTVIGHVRFTEEELLQEISVDRRGDLGCAPAAPSAKGPVAATP